MIAVTGWKAECIEINYYRLKRKLKCRLIKELKCRCMRRSRTSRRLLLLSNNLSFTIIRYSITGKIM
jgi:hypothetical protein